VDQYKRPYKLNNTMTKLGMNIAHGGAKKFYLFDMVSNQPITEVCDTDKERMESIRNGI
jgi:hypothetical protein